MTIYLKKVRDYYNSIAFKYEHLKSRNKYYHEQILKLYKFLIPKNQKVVEIGCATGDLLSSLNASKGVGIDVSEKMIYIARKKYPNFRFVNGYAENISVKEKFDYVILSDLVGILDDIQQAFLELHKITNEDSRIIISYHNYFWEPFLTFVSKIGLKTPQPSQNWVSDEDIENFLELADLEAIKSNTFLLIPFYIPIFSSLLNKYIARLPIIRNLCLVRYFIVRKKPHLSSSKDYSVSIILPARNEEGNIEEAVKKIPQLGRKSVLVFVEGGSKDNTRSEIIRVKNKYKGEREIVLVDQEKGIGKGDGVRRGIAKSKGDIIIIFDTDLTVDPKDLPKFYNAIKDGKAELIQGSRLVYDIEPEAMQALNVFGNKFFSIAFSYLLDQGIKDTLCGTKVLLRKDYEKIAKTRSYFGKFDPFGDFDLIFGASKLNLKIMEIPIRYKARSYGKTNISRFSHGWLLLKMTILAARKIKFF